MKTQNPFLGRRFFGRFGSVCAVCTALASTALGQTTSKSTTSTSSPKAAAPAPSGNGDIKVTEYGDVDIAVQDTDLADVLQMLAIESKRNVIINKNVSAKVTAYLYDVTLPQALKAILRPNGYDFIEEGNFIYVYTIEELAAMEKANQKTQSRSFVLDYLSAEDAEKFITPLLSDAGKAAARGTVQAGFKPTQDDGGADGYAFSATIVVNDYEDNLTRIAELLKTLDVQPKQVLVESVILQSSVDESNAFGIDFSVIGSVDFTDLTAPLDAVTNLLNGSDATSGFQPSDNNAQGGTTSVGNTRDGAGGLKIGFVSNDISVFLRVLDEVTDSTVLAKPKVMALNRQRAQVLVGARIGYLSTTATETTTTQSVKFLDTGIKLVFRPFISDDGSIRMELSPSVSEASLRVVTDSNNASVTIPDELTNELQTNVRMRSGQTLVLGGLYKESVRNTRRQVPILGDLPILGVAFRGQDDTVDRDEIIFLITPTVVEDDLLWKHGAEVASYLETARVGMREGLLPFSREAMTSNHNRDAFEAFNSGDSELALYHINNSLRLNPRQPEMTRFRDQVSGGAASSVPEKSIFERVYHSRNGSKKAAFAFEPTDFTPATFPTRPTTTASSTTPTTPTTGSSEPTEWFDAGSGTTVTSVPESTTQPTTETTQPSTPTVQPKTTAAGSTASTTSPTQPMITAAQSQPQAKTATPKSGYATAPAGTIPQNPEQFVTFDHMMQRLFTQLGLGQFNTTMTDEPTAAVDTDESSDDHQH